VAVGNLRWMSMQVRWAPMGTTAGACGNGHGRKHVGRQLKRLQCTRRKHVGREHVPSANMSGANMYRALTCRAPTYGHQLKGANLTPFFSKNTPKLPFLAEEAQMNFFNFFFALSIVGSCPRLLREHVQNISQNLTTRIVR
jgi:hypothetical protein